ncbi:unnamed protein product [Prunus armeniaca]|uniref:Uncharacterized protein n=1 Tax=Prunus armeniaca TaxID=36596 RepID=A0A6J5U2U2_PRUAR|nr:unnamed protein product [Prunus armeniaca]
MSKKGGFGGVCGHAHDPCRLAIRAKPAQAEFGKLGLCTFGKEAKIGIEGLGLGLLEGASSSFGKAELLGLRVRKGYRHSARGINDSVKIWSVRALGCSRPFHFSAEQPIGEAKLSCREVASIFSPPFSFHTALAIRQGCVLFLSWPLRVDSWKEEIGAGTVRQGGAWGEAGFILFILPLVSSEFGKRVVPGRGFG